jgi:hypothetical protein
MQRLILVAMWHNILVRVENKEVGTTHRNEGHCTESKVGEEQIPTTVYINEVRLL